MRKLVELTVVFLLGWALALYILEDRRSDNPGEGEVSVDAAHNPAITDYPSPSHQGGNAAIKKSAATEQPEQAKQLLERGDIDAFMALLQKHRVPADETLWQNYRTVFFNALQQLKNNSHDDNNLKRRNLNVTYS